VGRDALAAKFSGSLFATRAIRSPMDGGTAGGAPVGDVESALDAILHFAVWRCRFVDRAISLAFEGRRDGVVHNEILWRLNRLPILRADFLVSL
jgi:hypothetical protein